MIKNVSFISITILLFLAVSCKPSVSIDKLYGKWKYIKVENPNARPPDSIRSAELKYQAPFIQFTKNKDLIIIWGGKILSHGKFSIDGYNIIYNESLPDGKKRAFSFWVSKLTDTDMIFETKGEDGSRVTAVKF